MPSVLTWPDMKVKMRSSTQTTLRYPARGAATIWEKALPESSALRGLLGAPRVRLLLTLRSPATTTALARSLTIPPTAVYQTSDLGLALLDVSR